MKSRLLVSTSNIRGIYKAARRPRRLHPTMKTRATRGLLTGNDKSFRHSAFCLGRPAYLITSEYRVNERGERRRLREDEQDAEQQKDDDYRQKPKLLVLPKEQPDLTGERELAHKN